jgi:hypothetical protein
MCKRRCLSFSRHSALLRKCRTYFLFFKALHLLPLGQIHAEVINALEATWQSTTSFSAANSITVEVVAF